MANSGDNTRISLGNPQGLTVEVRVEEDGSVRLLDLELPLLPSVGTIIHADGHVYEVVAVTHDASGGDQHRILLRSVTRPPPAA